MQKKQSKFKLFSSRNRYIPVVVVIAIIAIIAVLGYFNVKEIINSIKHDGSIINISGKQRMLSQRLVLLAQNYNDNPSIENKELLLDGVQNIVSAHEFLLKNTSSKQRELIYYKGGLDRDLNAYLDGIVQLVYMPENNDELIRSLIKQSQDLLKKLDNAVKSYEVANEEQLKKLETEQTYIILAILITLLLEAIFVSIPVNKRIKKNTEQLQVAVDEKTWELQKSLDLITNHVIYSRTDLRGVITYASKAFSKVSGYKNEELIGKPHNIVRHEDMPKEAFKQMWDTIKRGKMWRGEVKNRKKDGGYYWVDAYIEPEYDKKGEHIGYAAVRHQITAKKEVEKLNHDLEERIHKEVAKNRAKDEKLHEQQKMLQMSELLGNIAHHWRQPLSAISTAASGLILKKEVNILSDDEYEETLKKIMGITKDLSQTIDEFTGFVKIDKTPVVFEFQKICNDTISLILNAYQNNKIQLVIDIEEEPLHVFGVASLLSQAILNILTNAKDIILERHILNPMVRVKMKKENDYAKLVIGDNAGGVDEAIINKIFDPYFTTKHQSQGTGMGLHYTYKLIVSEFKGELSVQNKNEGAEFTIVIPLTEAPTD